MSDGARRLYAGVKMTKDSIEMLMRDQDAALLNIAKHLGMFEKKFKHSGRDGEPIPISIIEIVRPAAREST